jgi:hypothetical protein
MQVEELDRHQWKIRAELANAIFETSGFHDRHAVTQPMACSRQSSTRTVSNASWMRITLLAPRN